MLHGSQAQYVRVPLADFTLVKVRQDDKLQTLKHCGCLLQTTASAAQIVVSG